MGSLAGKNVLITGAASGIGKLMAGYFSEEGCRLALLDINKAMLDETKEGVARHGVKAEAYRCDISDESSIDEAVSAVSRDFSQIDILVNNAGIVIGKQFLDLTLQEFRKVMDVNLMGAVMMTRKILPQMMQRKTGQIVNIASTAGFLGMPQMTEYCASKFANIGFSDALRLELKTMGYKKIKITVVCPYVISTGMFTGFKPLFLNPELKPEVVARKVVQATRKAKPYLFLPAYIRSLYLTKLLPVWVTDLTMLLLGAGRAMKNFTGRK